MLNKKVTRKEFLVSALSIAALFAVSGKVSQAVKKFNSPKQKDGIAYGHYPYGGGKKNV